MASPTPGIFGRPCGTDFSYPCATTSPGAAIFGFHFGTLEPGMAPIQILEIGETGLIQSSVTKSFGSGEFLGTPGALTGEPLSILAADL